MTTLFHPTHPHYAVHKAHVEGCFANPDNPPVVEFFDSDDNFWTEIGKPSWEKVYQYRLKPRTVTRTVTYPEPMREPPPHGTTVWIVCSQNTSPIGINRAHVIGMTCALKNGMCFATKADAQACYDAIFGSEK